MALYTAEVGCDPRDLTHHLDTNTICVSKSLAIKSIRSSTHLPHLQVGDYAACNGTAARFAPTHHASPDEHLPSRLGSDGTDRGGQLEGVASDGRANKVSSDIPTEAGDSLTESGEPSSQQTRLPKHV